MATGYTAAIEKGIDFREFVLRCAKGMGACVTLRDEARNMTPLAIKEREKFMKEYQLVLFEEHPENKLTEKEG